MGNWCQTEATRVYTVFSTNIYGSSLSVGKIMFFLERHASLNLSGGSNAFFKEVMIWIERGGGAEFIK